MTQLENLLDPNSSEWSNLRNSTMPLISQSARKYESKISGTLLSEKRLNFAKELTDILGLKSSGCRQYLNKIAGSINKRYGRPTTEYYGPPIINCTLPLFNEYGLGPDRSLEKLSLVLNYIQIDQQEKVITNLKKLYPLHFTYPPLPSEKKQTINNLVTKMIFSDEY